MSDINYVKVKRMVSILFLCFSSLSVNGQHIEYGPINTRNIPTGGVEHKTHIKKVLEFDSIPATRLYNLTKLWFEENYWKKGLVYKWGFGGSAGRMGLIREKSKPFVIDSTDVVLKSEYIKCESCFYYRGKGDMTFTLDIEFKDGRLLLKVYDWLSEGVFASVYTTKKGKIILGNEDKTILALENHFQMIALNLGEFILSNPKKESDLKKVNNW